MPKQEGIPMSEFMQKIRTPGKDPEEHFKRFVEAFKCSKFSLKLRVEEARIIVSALHAVRMGADNIDPKTAKHMQNAMKRVTKYLERYLDKTRGKYGKFI